MSVRLDKRWGLASRLLVAQVLVLLASILTAGLAALVAGPQLFHQHLLQAGQAPSSPELPHIEAAYQDASLVSLGVALVVALGCAVAVTWFITRRLQAPLQALTDAASEISRGHLRTRVGDVGGGPEFNTLGTAFNLMAGRLEQTEDTRRRLLSDLAHELRTPVATIKVYWEGMRDGVIPSDENTDRVMTEQVERIARLTEDLDEVSRAEEGRLDLERTPTSAAELVRSATAAHREAYTRKGVSLVVDTDATPDAAVSVDPRRLGQVLGNLLANALRHTPPDGTVVVRSSTGADGEVEISVADTGDGISREQLPHVFERFYRGDSARDRDRGGSGIGLTISKAIVDAHGGALVARSDGPGRGATFTISLPRSTQPPE